LWSIELFIHSLLNFHRSFTKIGRICVTLELVATI
jgi:hypothetical protein